MWKSRVLEPSEEKKSQKNKGMSGWEPNCLKHRRIFIHLRFGTLNCISLLIYDPLNKKMHTDSFPTSLGMYQMTPCRIYSRNLGNCTKVKYPENVEATYSLVIILSINNGQLKEFCCVFMCSLDHSVFCEHVYLCQKQILIIYQMHDFTEISFLRIIMTFRNMNFFSFSFFYFFVFLLFRGSNPGPCTCEAHTWLTELHPES